jgi:GTP-binding protein
VSTHEVNDTLRALVAKAKPPHFGGHPVKLMYATQTAVAPPTFLVWSNHPEGVPESYQRYIYNGFREAWGFLGAPVRIELRGRKEGEGDEQ